MPDSGEKTVTADDVFERLVESLAREGRSDKNWEWLAPSVRALRRDKVRELLTDAGVPAMVEALAQIAGSVDYEPSDDEVRRVGREWFEGFNDARQRAAEIARAVLGGEVQERSDTESPLPVAKADAECFPPVERIGHSRLVTVEHDDDFAVWRDPDRVLWVRRLAGDDIEWRRLADVLAGVETLPASTSIDRGDE